jgi:hypothetical protein
MLTCSIKERREYWYSNQFNNLKYFSAVDSRVTTYVSAVTTYVSTSSTIHVCTSQSLLSKLVETLRRGKSNVTLGGGGTTVRESPVNRLAFNRIREIIPEDLRV